MFFLRIVFALALLSVTPGQASSDNAPQEIAGIKLGTSIEMYPDFEVSNYLKETVVMDWHGFRKGIISYGFCHAPGIIVKLQMKYEDSSKQFFETLMQRYTKEFGTPKEWKGDSFGIKHIWKWQFRDNQGRAVSMVLQHNLRDVDENTGNQVKLSYPEMIENERLCFIEHCKERIDPEQRERKEKLRETGWDYLIPR
jgi:hypothetical protein